MSEESSLALVDAIEAYRAAFFSRDNETELPVPSGGSLDSVDFVWGGSFADGIQGGYGQAGVYRVQLQVATIDRHAPVIRGYRGKHMVIPEDCNRLDCVELADDLDLRPVCVDEPVWEERVGSFGSWDPISRAPGTGSEPYKHKDGFCLGLPQSGNGVEGHNLSWTGLAVPVTELGLGQVSFDNTYYYLTGGYVDLPGLGDIAEALVDTIRKGYCEAVNILLDLASISLDCGPNPWTEVTDVIKGDVVGFPISIFEQSGTVRFATIRHPSAGP